MGKPRLIYGMEMRDYHLAEGVSASRLKRMARSPAAALIEEEETPAMAFGTALHCAVLEPDELFNRYALEPQPPDDFDGVKWRATKAYKDQKAALLDDGIIPLSHSEIESLSMVMTNILVSGIGALIYKEDRWVETSVFVDSDEHPMLGRKCRPDLYLPTARTVVDVKSTKDHRPDAFARQVANLSYHMGAAFYIETMEMAGVAVDNYLFLAINNTKPHEVALYTLDLDSLTQGEMEMSSLMGRWEACVRDNSWPAYSEEGGGAVVEIRLPEYRLGMVKEPAW